MQAEAAKLRRVAEALAVLHDGGIRHLAGGFNVALEAAVQVIVAAELVDRLEDIPRAAQRAVICVAVHWLAEGVNRLLAVRPQVEEIDLLGQRLDKAFHDARHRPDVRRRVGAHAPAVEEEAGVRHDLADGVVGIFREVQIDLDEVLDVRRDMVLRRRGGGEVAARAVRLDPRLHARLDEAAVERIVGIEVRHDVGRGGVVLDPLAAEIAGVRVHSAELEARLLRQKVDHRLHAEAARILGRLADSAHPLEILLCDGLRGDAHLLEDALAEVAVPGVEAERVDLVPREELELAAALLPREEGGEIVHPLADRVAEAERGALDRQAVRDGEVGLRVEDVAVEVEAGVKARLQQVEHSVVHGAVVRTAQNQLLPLRAENHAVVLRLAFRREAPGLGAQADPLVRRGAADADAPALHRAGILLVCQQKSRAAEPLDIALQLLGGVRFEPGRVFTENDAGNCLSFFRNLHEIPLPASLSSRVCVRNRIPAFHRSSSV